MTTLNTIEWKIPETIDLEEEWRTIAMRAEAEANKYREFAVALAAKLERGTMKTYERGVAAGFERGVAAGFEAAMAALAQAEEARSLEPQRRTVERDEAGRIVAIVG